MKTPIVAVLVLLVLVGGYMMTVYNGLVTEHEKIDAQWAQVETQYQRRLDLIPNLVASVEGAMNQEKSVFGAIAEARTRYAGAGTVDEKARAATALDSAFGRLLVIIENYPQLRSIDTVQDLMSELEGTENRISVERMRFNDTVRAYNTRVKRIPAKWVASASGFSERAYYEAVEGAEIAPVVDIAPSVSM